MMEYKSYIGKIDYDQEAEIFHGEVINLQDVITFQGKSVRELKKAFKDSVEDYLAFCEERGESPEKPFSGRFVLRLDPKNHRQIYLASQKEGLSLNRWAVQVLAEAAQTAS